uniref:Uncharacterized protein n=1 Tax=Arundo donax TaxID=35708 RepID=A0A0A9HCP3_ARUDO
MMTLLLVPRFAALALASASVYLD